jgi:polar amino acid transport system substrate-binding protein
MFRIFPRALLSGLFSAVALTAVSASELEYAYPDQSVWTTRIDDKGEPRNPLLGLADAMFTEAGVNWHGRSYPATRLFDYLKAGTAHFSMLVSSPALKECCLLSKAPVAGTELRVYRTADMPAIRDKADLVGKSVISIRGYSYGGLLGFLNDPANSITNTVVTKHEHAFAMLDRGRGDYVLDYAGPGTEVLNAQPRADVRYDTLSRLDVYLVLVKSYPDAARLMARLEAIAERLDKDRILADAVH